MAEPFAHCVDERFLVGDLEITRVHNKGWPFTEEHFIYTVVGSREALLAEGLCKVECFPIGRKRTSYGGPLAGTQEGEWKMRRRKGDVWELRLWPPRGHAVRDACCERLIEQHLRSRRPRLVTVDGARV